MATRTRTSTVTRSRLRGGAERAGHIALFNADASRACCASTFFLPMSNTRIEKDSMGTMEVPADALYGASTQRAVLNFPVSGRGFGREFIRALGLIKAACAQANLELGRLSQERVDLIARAAQEVIDGKLDAPFPVDIYHTASDSSTNMNVT